MNAMIAADVPRRSHSAVSPLIEWAVGNAVTPAEVAHLRASAEQSIASMQAFMKTSLAEGAAAAFNSTLDLEDLPEPEQAAYWEQLNSTLAVVRNSRDLYEGPAYVRFSRLVEAHAPDLAPAFRRAHLDFVAFSRELERMLILFGAGNDQDGLTLDVIPNVA